MSTKQRRTNPHQVSADVRIANMLAQIPGYEPNDTTYALGAVQKALDDYVTARAEENHMRSVLLAARLRLRAAEDKLHDLILGAKLQVQAQFGRDSAQVHLVGLKQKSERKPRRSPAAPSTNPPETAPPPKPDP